MNEELLYNQIYEKTIDCGRTQFVRLLMDKERENQELKEQQKEFMKWLEYEIKACELTCDLIFNHNKEMKIYKEILSKYKQITGSDK